MKIINQFLQEAKNALTIYCDMDGVLCDFESQFEKMGHGTIEKVEKRYGPEAPWKMITKAGVSFWSLMPWMPDGKRLWQFIKKYDVKILSSPVKSNASKVGKKLWVRKNLGKDVELILSPSREKQQYASSNAILIDDKLRTIKEWRSKGGIAIHHKNANDTIKKLKKLV